MIVISELKDGAVPTIELGVKIKKDTPATPGDVASSKLVTLNKKGKALATLKLAGGDGGRVQVLEANTPAPPKWKVKVALGDAAEAKEGSNIYVNALLSFDEKPGKRNISCKRINIGDVGEGDWLFPVIVTVGKDKYLLAYVKVIITWESKEPEQ